MYRLYSRSRGWPTGEIIKYFNTQPINDNGIIKKYGLLGLQGSEIINKMDSYKLQHIVLYNHCKTFKNWYLYEADTVITSQNSL